MLCVCFSLYKQRTSDNFGSVDSMNTGGYQHNTIQTDEQFLIVFFLIRIVRITQFKRYFHHRTVVAGGYTFVYQTSPSRFHFIDDLWKCRNVYVNWMCFTYVYVAAAIESDSAMNLPSVISFYLKYDIQRRIQRTIHIHHLYPVGRRRACQTNQSNAAPSKIAEFLRF